VDVVQIYLIFNTFQRFLWPFSCQAGLALCRLVTDQFLTEWLNGCVYLLNTADEDCGSGYKLRWWDDKCDDRTDCCRYSFTEWTVGIVGRCPSWRVCNSCTSLSVIYWCIICKICKYDGLASEHLKADTEYVRGCHCSHVYHLFCVCFCVISHVICSWRHSLTWFSCVYFSMMLCVLFVRLLLTS